MHFHDRCYCDLIAMHDTAADDNEDESVAEVATSQSESSKADPTNATSVLLHSFIHPLIHTLIPSFFHSL